MSGPNSLDDCTKCEPADVVPEGVPAWARRFYRAIQSHPDWFSVPVERGPTPIKPYDWRRYL